MPKKKEETIKKENNTIKKATKKTKRKNTSNKIGAIFEERVQHKLDEYKKQGLAYINKVPTEFKILRIGGKVINAFPVSQSRFCDFTGVIKGIGHCDIEVKTCSNKTSFPLSNIIESEFEYMSFMYHEMNQRHLYYLIEMRELKEIYLFKAIDIENFRKEQTRKSLPISWMRENGILIDNKLNFIEHILNN